MIGGFSEYMAEVPVTGALPQKLEPQESKSKYIGVFVIGVASRISQIRLVRQPIRVTSGAVRPPPCWLAGTNKETTPQAGQGCGR